MQNSHDLAHSMNFNLTLIKQTVKFYINSTNNVFPSGMMKSIISELFLSLLSYNQLHLSSLQKF